MRRDYIKSEDELNRELEKARGYLEGVNLTKPLFRGIGEELQELFKNEINKKVYTKGGWFLKKYQVGVKEIKEKYSNKLKILSKLSNKVGGFYIKITEYVEIGIQYKYNPNENHLQITETRYFLELGAEYKGNRGVLVGINPFGNERFEPIDIEKEIKQYRGYLNKIMVMNLEKEKLSDILKGWDCY